MRKAITIMIAIILAGGCCQKCCETTRTIVGKGGLIMRVSDIGCAVVGLEVPTKGGDTIDVIGGRERNPAFFGAVVGRYANRIANGRFTLDGVEYQNELNDPDHHATCHSGDTAWHTVRWNARTFENGDDVGIVYTRVFPDGECGFPGTVNAKVTYTLSADNVWRIEYEATSDKATPMNPSNHAYWNLNGKGTIEDHVLTIAAENYLAVNDDLIPIGSPKAVAGSEFDFRAPRKIGKKAAYDHNWCTDGEGFRKVARLEGEVLAMEIWTDQPGLQFYAGGFIDNAALALETQHWPNSPNRPDFASTILRPNETYYSKSEYRFMPITD